MLSCDENKISIHFAPGNGFPAEIYQEMFDFLGNDYAVHYLPIYGQGGYEVTDNWPGLVDQLINFIKSKNEAPVIGIGHSMGGVLMYMAACQAPELFRQVIALDSPLIGFWRSLAVYLAKMFHFTHHFMPVERAKSRRVLFESPAEAFHYFRKKSLFKNFSTKSLELYVQYGLVSTEEGYVLRFDRETEAQIYATMPDNLYSFQKPANLPGALLYSVYSDLVKPSMFYAIRKHYGLTLHPFHRGGHLFPLEYPELTAQAIHTLLLKR